MGTETLTPPPGYGTVSNLYNDSKLYPMIQQTAKDVGKFAEDTFRSWRPKYLIQLKALAPKLKEALDSIEQNEHSVLGQEMDANLYAALTQQCDGSFTGILALHNVSEPGAKSMEIYDAEN